MLWHQYDLKETWTNVTNAGSGKTDAFGRELSVAQALSSSVGIKLGSYPRDVLMLNAKSKADAEVMEIQRNIAKLKREFARGGMDRAEFSEKIEAQVQKKISIKESLQQKAR